ncbi:hypothetical protein HY571_01955 [Candidatus Micrarchaeota archaeon]|nr:hypothetical protein [Candidatus Micrarchaeota archaeon]
MPSKKTRKLKAEAEIASAVYNNDIGNWEPMNSIHSLTRRIGRGLGLYIPAQGEAMTGKVERNQTAKGLSLPKTRGTGSLAFKYGPPEKPNTGRFHFPVDFDKGPAQFHVLSVKDQHGTPLLTFSKAVPDPKLVITSHNADGHALAQLVMVNLWRASVRHAAKHGLKTPNISLVKAAEFKEKTHVRKLKEVVRELREELEHAEKRRQRTQDLLEVARRVTAPGIVQVVDQRTVQEARKALREVGRIQTQHEQATTEAQRLRETLRKIARVARSASLGTRGKALKAIAREAERLTAE